MKIKVLILFGLVFGLFVFIFFYVVKIRKSYIKNVLKMENLKVFFHYESPFIHYFDENSECPRTIGEAFVLKPNNIDFERYMDFQFRDYLNKDKGLIQYIPLYNKFTLKRESFLLVSSGIDGHFNNTVSTNDTIYIDNNPKPFKFYNTSKYYKLGDPIRTDTTFNLFNYLFGTKDYLLAYVNWRDYYMMQVRRLYSPKDLVNQVKNHNYFEKVNKISNQVYGYYGIYTKDTLINKARYIYFNTNNFLIINKLYDAADFTVSKGDSVTFAGLLVSFDSKDRKMEFNNCFILDSITERASKKEY